MIIVSGGFTKYNASGRNGKILITLLEEEELDLDMCLLTLFL